MKAATIHEQGVPVSPNIRLVEDWPEPTPASGEVLVRTEASSLNHLDLWVGQGLPGLGVTYPLISGSDGAGVVEAVGNGVSPRWVGRRVLLNAAVPVDEETQPDGLPAPRDLRIIGEHSTGCHAEKFVAPAAQLVDIGDADPSEAAAFALAHLTAWRMLSTRAGLRAGQWVLVTGIGGGVALAALGIAKHLGCRVVVTSRHEWKLERATALGADAAVLDTGEDWSRDVRSHTGKRGVDVCVDSIGAAAHLSCVKSLARGGTLVLCGCTSGHAPNTDLARLFWNQQSIVGSTMGDMDEFRQVVSLFRSGALRPVVDSVHDATDAAAAFARLESAEQFGKVVLRWS